MSIQNSVRRLATYSKRHGLRATAERAVQAASRALFSRRMVLFYFDLGDEIPGLSAMPAHITLERKKSEHDISPGDLERFLSFWNPELAALQIKERFRQGASLWLLKVDGTIAGYGWTLRGTTMEPHYFPLGQNDEHLFDYYVAPSYRGRGLNPLLVNHILHRLAEGAGRRAFIEAGEWNVAQLASLKKTPFRQLGYASKSTAKGRTVVRWDRPGGPAIETNPLPADSRTFV